MLDKPAAEFFLHDFFSRWTSHLVKGTRKPWIAAVNGFALGGGCELAMMADFIIAADTAKFGQPEIKLGVAPGMGGSQRLTRAIGKAKAMDLCLTGRMMDAAEAEQQGLVARVVPLASLMEEAVKAAQTIAGMAPMAALMNKEMVNAAFETTLDQGLLLERRMFQVLTASEDRVEGMTPLSKSARRSGRASVSLKIRRKSRILQHRRSPAQPPTAYHRWMAGPGNLPGNTSLHSGKASQHKSRHDYA
jgi:enoyl-CoA hydratase